MKLIFFLIVFSNLSITQDEYVLPQEIKTQLEKTLESKRQLDISIIKTYKKLCWKSSLNEAEYIELLAYKEITGLTCSDVILLDV